MADATLHSVMGVVVGACVGLILVALTRMPGGRIARPVQAFVCAGALWAIGDLVATAASDMAWKQAGLVTLYTGAITLPALWWMIAVRWSQDIGADLPLEHPAWTAAPLAFAGVMWLVMITNPVHGAFLVPVIGGHNVYQPLWYAMAIPNYALVVAALGVEIAAVRRVPKHAVRRQAGLLIGASLLTLVGNLVYVTDLVPWNPMPLVLALSAALLVAGMARDGLFGVLPAALPAIAADHPDGLLIVGTDGAVQWANARARELLAPLDPTCGERVLAVLRAAGLQPDPSSPIGDDGSDAAWWSALTDERGVLFRKEDAEEPRWLHASAWPVLGQRDRHRGHCLRISDLTARRRVELHERQTRRLESVASLARTVSRDFQGAFAIIRGNAELLTDSRDLPPDDARKVSRIFEAADGGLDAARQLQLYAGSVDTARVVLELTTIVDEICGVVEEDWPPGLRLRIERCALALPIDADPLHLRHGVFNLLMNAFDAMRDAPGEVRVETGARRLDPEAMTGLVHGQDEPPGDFAYVRVSDQGGGMDPETEERAFEPFFSTRHKERGEGLSTVLGLARTHDGLIALDNQPGRGCTFTLYLPLVDDAELDETARGH